MNIFKKLGSLLLIVFTMSCSNMKVVKKDNVNQLNKQQKKRCQIRQITKSIQKVINDSEIIRAFQIDTECTYIFLRSLEFAKYHLMNNMDLTYTQVSSAIRRFQYSLHDVEKPYLFYAVNHIDKKLHLNKNISNNTISLYDRNFLLLVVILIDMEIQKKLVDKSI